MLSFNEYQEQALLTDDSRDKGTVSAQFFAVALGLMSEAGEFGEKLKKIYWHKEGAWDEEDKKLLAKELGDCLWYIASLSNHLGIPMEEIAKGNIEKLKSRVERGVHRGFGDER